MNLLPLSNVITLIFINEILILPQMHLVGLHIRYPFVQEYHLSRFDPQTVGLRLTMKNIDNIFPTNNSVKIFLEALNFWSMINSCF